MGGGEGLRDHHELLRPREGGEAVFLKVTCKVDRMKLFFFFFQYIVSISKKKISFKNFFIERFFLF